MLALSGVGPRLGGGGLVIDSSEAFAPYVGGGLVQSSPVGGAKLVGMELTSGGKVASVGVEVRSGATTAVAQTDQIDINGIAAGGKLVIDFGVIHEFIDLSATPLALGEILMIDANGSSHDLAVLTRTKAHTLPQPIQFPPGRYEFLNVSGGALSGKTVFVQHTGARNLA